LSDFPCSIASSRPMPSQSCSVFLLAPLRSSRRPDEEDLRFLRLPCPTRYRDLVANLVPGSSPSFGASRRRHLLRPLRRVGVPTMLCSIVPRRADAVGGVGNPPLSPLEGGSPSFARGHAAQSPDFEILPYSRWPWKQTKRASSRVAGPLLRSLRKSQTFPVLS